MNISWPVSVFNKQTFLMRHAQMCQIIPKYIKNVYKNSKDNIIQLGSLAAWWTGYYNNNLDQRKPFNPIWGET